MPLWKDIVYDDYMMHYLLYELDFEGFDLTDDLLSNILAEDGMNLRLK